MTTLPGKAAAVPPIGATPAPPQRSKSSGWKSSELHGSAASGGVLATIAMTEASPLALRIIATLGLIAITLTYLVARTAAKHPLGILALSAGWTVRRLVAAITASSDPAERTRN